MGLRLVCFLVAYLMAHMPHWTVLDLRFGRFLRELVRDHGAAERLC
jgi:hypothetical protein